MQRSKIMVDFSKIKLIIWDLDCTLWNGTVSEEEIAPIAENISLIKNTTDMGIVNSICSKNDFSTAEKKLMKLGLWDYFVFPSINWDSKGKRVQNIISSMSLRPANVLFVDDNPQNLKEAEFYCPQIMTALPEELSALYSLAESSEKKDTTHKRLNQYKLLEKKAEYKKDFSSNDDFLMSCGIQVEIKHDCTENIDRIYDLVQRSNQLNYTKVRSSKEELLSLFASNAQCGYITAKDKFGDYGIVGFYALSGLKLIHYTFSCRTLGMQIEQYVYMKLGCPQFELVGDVVSELNTSFMPPWINNSTSTEEGKYTTDTKILIKGPCDMSQMFSFINESDKISTEFTYIGENGISVEGHNHSAQVVTSLLANKQRKTEILTEFSWFDKHMLSTKLENETFDYVVFSMFTDANLGAYRRKSTGEVVSLCEKYYDLTNTENHQLYIDKSIFTSNIDFAKEELERFSELYERIDNDDFSLTLNSLSVIVQKIGTGKLILILPTEREYTKNKKVSYESRHIEHSRLNNAIKSWANNKDNVILLPIDKYIHSENDFTDSINHFVKRVYFDLAKELVEIMNEKSVSFYTKGKYFLLKEIFVHYARLIKNKILKYRNQ